MIAIANDSCRRQNANTTAEAFEAMLPTIRRVASYGFRRVPRWRRQELISDVVALAFVAFAQLVHRRKAALAFPSVLAWYGVRRVAAGRKVGVKQNVRDALSPLAQRRNGFSVELLSDWQDHGGWQQLADDRRATPAEIAAARIDVASWFGRLQQFKRQVALRLAHGDTTSDAAKHFRVSPARISQIRQELRADWNQFQVVPAVA
jgi:hypothetical protein